MPCEEVSVPDSGISQSDLNDKVLLGAGLVLTGAGAYVAAGKMGK